jgi:hypothetical protein
MEQHLGPPREGQDKEESLVGAGKIESSSFIHYQTGQKASTAITSINLQISPFKSTT